MREGKASRRQGKGLPMPVPTALVGACKGELAVGDREGGKRKGRGRERVGPTVDMHGDCPRQNHGLGRATALNEDTTRLVLVSK